MNERLEKLLNQIGINEDYVEYFKDSFVEKVKIDKTTSRFHFIIRIGNILPLRVYQDLLSSLKSAFHNEIKLTLNYDGEDYMKIEEYLNHIITNYAKEGVRYSVFQGRKVNIDKWNVEFIVNNKIEELNMNHIKGNIEKELKTYGFTNLNFITKLELAEEQELLDRIESEKNVTELPTFKEKSSISNSQAQANTTEKPYYRPKKSTEVTKIKDLLYETENVNIEVQIFGIDLFEAKSGYKIFTLKVTDFSDSMYAKIFTKDEEEFARIKDLLKNGNWYAMYGRVKEDNFANNELVFMTRYKDITPIDAKLDWVRTDKSEEKRVELHAHTMMSQMDGVIDEIKLIKTAIKWGHRAIAITDHDGCQAFPHVYNEVTGYNKKILSPFKDKIKELTQTKKEKEEADDVCGAKLLEEEIEKVKSEMEKAPTFKALYGTELEMSDDTLDIVVNPTDDDIYKSTYVIFDTETTGFNPGLHDTMIEIGAVKMKDGAVIESFDELINPGVLIDSEITELTGINNNMVKDCPNEEEVTKKFKSWIGNLPLVAHNAKFDKNMLEMAYHKYGLGTLDNTILDTMIISQIINKDLKRHNLTALTKNYGITFEENDGTGEKHHHRADYDAEFTGYVFFKMLKQLDQNTIKTFKDLASLPTKEEINKWNREKHVNMIAKTRTGLKNMFKLISYGSTTYLVKSARVPRSIIEEYREDLLIGSGCYNGEIFNTALTRSEEDLMKAMDFYDYIEVQPPSNYTHLIARHDINTAEDVKYAIEKIVKCAKKVGKLIVATSDAHTLNQEDKIYREIIVHQNVPGKGRHPLARYLNTDGYKTIPDQYFRTTDEMLEEFAFLGTEVAKEIVITNTNKIADQCGEYEVIIDTGGIPFSPKIDNSIMTVIDLVYTKAASWYGNPLPYNIEERIAKELYGDSVFESVKYLLKESGMEEGEEFEKEAYQRLHDTIFRGDDEVRRIVGEKIQKTSEQKLSEEELKKQISKNLGGIIGGGFDVIYLIAQKLVKHSNDEGFLVGSRGSVGSSFVATMMGIT